MTKKKFFSEVETLKSFFELYCKDKHKGQKLYFHSLSYNQKDTFYELELCEECYELIKYSFDRLKECPHEEKPRCRKCPAPCYDKEEWKKLAKLMRYSGVKKGLLKMKNYISS